MVGYGWLLAFTVTLRYALYHVGWLDTAFDPTFDGLDGLRCCCTFPMLYYDVPVTLPTARYLRCLHLRMICGYTTALDSFTRLDYGYVPVCPLVGYTFALVTFIVTFMRMNTVTDSVARWAGVYIVRFYDLTTVAVNSPFPTFPVPFPVTFPTRYVDSARYPFTLLLICCCWIAVACPVGWLIWLLLDAPVVVVVICYCPVGRCYVG